MIIRGKLGRGVLGGGVMMAAAMLSMGSASAQLFWDWGGGNTVNGSGREMVSFSPQYAKGQIIVSFTDKRLYYISAPGQAISYPVAAPREQSRWQGVTSITQKRVNPSWTPTPTMVAENPRLPRWVPGGHPMNPLGVRALYLGSSMYRIHGTDAPWTIGTSVSKGCIRMYNQDVLDLYPRVNVGTKVTVTFQAFTTGNVAPSANTKTNPNTNVNTNTSNGSVFDLFGDDDQAPPKAAPKRKSSTRDKSASVQ